MKTLDKLIEALEEMIANPTEGDFENEGYYLAKDSLYYLKKYCDNYEALNYLKKYRDNYEARNYQVERYQKAHQCEEILKNYIALRQYCAEAQDNPPLTWDELKQMEGKPVWVEILSDEIDLSSRWMMVARETKAHSLPLAYTDDIGHWIYGHEDKLGKTWQAYRKEQFNTEYEDIPMEYFENGGI